MAASRYELLLSYLRGRPPKRIGGSPREGCAAG